MSRLAVPLHLAILSVLICICVAPPPPGKGNGNGNGRGGDDDGPGRGNGNGNGNGRGNGNGKGHEVDYRGNQRRLDDNALNTLKTTCKGRGNCKGQSDKAKRNRNAVKESMKKDRKGDGKGGRRGLDDATVERRFQKTWQVKKQLFDVNGLTDVDPHDNGLLEGDMILNDDQLDKLLNRSKGILDPDQVGSVPLLDVESVAYNPLTGTGGRVKRADVLALDYYGGNKWPSTTINFYIDPSDFSTTEGNVIRNALKSISSASCLKFTEVWKYPVIEYVKTPSDTDDGTCGWSQVGYQGDYNAVNINFASSVCKSTLLGVIVHETLHALGFVHEHNRYDRDRYLDIDWNNCDPQSYDTYDKDDPHDHNPYCVAFDPLSIMIYDPYVAAIDPKKPVMKPKSYPDYYMPRMGQGTAMAASDAKLLNKMYCTSATCKDKSTNCGWTACTDCATYGSVCPRSCDKCT